MPVLLETPTCFSNVLVRMLVLTDAKQRRRYPRVVHSFFIAPLVYELCSHSLEEITNPCFVGNPILERFDLPLYASCTSLAYSFCNVPFAYPGKLSNFEVSHYSSVAVHPVFFFSGIDAREGIRNGMFPMGCSHERAHRDLKEGLKTELA